MVPVGGGRTTTYIYSGSKVIAEYSGGSLTKEYVYSGNSLLATIAGASVTYHYPDQLSNRLETDASGNVVRTFGHLPFGDVWYETGAADKWKFTGYERDNQSSESGLDYALNRFYSSAYGRFQSPDLLDGNPGDPQSWNHYAYVQNDPGNLLDPSGLQNRPVAAPANTGCAAGPLYGCPSWGNDIFDALDGAAGTFINIDEYGNVSWGWDSSLENISPGLKILYPNIGSGDGSVLSVYGWSYVGETQNDIYDDNKSLGGMWEYGLIGVIDLGTLSPSLMPAQPDTIGLPPPDSFRAALLRLPVSLDKKTNSHSYAEYLACSVDGMIENVDKYGEVMAGSLAGFAAGVRTGRPWMAVTGFTTLGVSIIGPAWATHSKCNDRVGGVIPNPF